MTNAFTSSGVFGDLFRDTEIATEFGADAFVQRMLTFEVAWTRALAECGAVSAHDAQVALDAIQHFECPDLSQGSNRDGLPVPALVKALKLGLSDGPASAIHTGATSQDVIDTAMMMTCATVTGTLAVRLENVIAAVDALAEQFDDRPMMARTRMQAALPATAALRLDGWMRPLADHLLRAEVIRGDLHVVQIGGPIGTRDDLADTLVQTVADTMGLNRAPVWHTDRSRIVNFGNWMTLVAGTLGKIGQDVILMAQQGIDEIAISGGGGSSAMAHKQNPVTAEALVTLARYIAGQQGILAQSMIHEQERSGTAWALEWMILPAMAEALGASLRHAESLLLSVKRIGAPTN